MSVAELARACVHCGLCLSKCPTYDVLREEADSPRGRIALLDAFASGAVRAEEVRPYLDRCVGCRACETVCPSGVRYGALLEEGRARLGGPRRLVRLFLERVLPRPKLLALLFALARAAGRAPRRAPPPPALELPRHPKARIALHRGCVLPHLFPRLVPESAFVLSRLGYRVEVPADWGCCGALHRHAGLERAAPAFGGYDAALTPAAGCSTTPGLTDLTAFLLRARPFPGAALPPTRVAYHPPCHLVAQGIDASAVLDGVPGIERVPLADAGACCGAGGLYMELQPRLARAVRARTLDAIARSGASIVISGNPGCMLWLARGLRARRLDVEVLHPVSLLARALPRHG